MLRWIHWKAEVKGNRQQTTESYCVSLESENATSLQLITNIEFLLYTIYNFLLHCQKQVYYLQVMSDGMLRITVSLLIVDTLQLKVQFTKNDKCVCINLDFTFLKCTFSLILHTSGPTRTFTKMLDFSWIHLCFVPISLIMCSSWAQIGTLLLLKLFSVSNLRERWRVTIQL